MIRLPESVLLSCAALAFAMPAAAAAPPVADWCPATAAAAATARNTVLREADKRLGDDPRPMPVVHTEGTLPGQGIREQSLIARRDLPQMRAFALAWKLSGDQRYAQALSRYLDAWTKVYRPSFSPIDETHFEAVADAYALAGEALPAPTRQAAEDFLRAMASGYVERMDRGRGERRSTWTNNWQSHRVKIVTLAAVALNDESLFVHARRLYLAQLADNIRVDGSVEDFHQRDALHYVTYDLEPLARAALAARLRGQDWLDLQSRSGSSLARALDWLLPYARGEKQHQEFQRSTVRFDTERRAAGVKGFAGTWERRSAAELFWTAAFLDQRYAETAKSLSVTPPDWMAACWLKSS